MVIGIRARVGALQVLGKDLFIGRLNLTRHVSFPKQGYPNVDPAIL